MKIEKSETGEFGKFKIYESDNRDIIQKFIDFETKLLIVIEKYRDLNAYGGYSYDYITVNPQNGDVIEVNERKSYINYNETEGESSDSKIKWRIKRVSWEKGREALEIEINSINETNPIKTEFFSAFSEKPHKLIPELYKEIIERIEEDRARKEKALADYLEKNYDERVKYWSGTLHQQMRWNGESGVDEYAIFSKNWLEEVKKVEPQIEKMLDEVIEKYWRGYWDSQKIREALKK